MNNELVGAVIEQLGGTESVRDIYNHGIDGGFGLFIYHSDTCAFFDANKGLILELLADMASEFEKSSIELVQSFGCVGADYLLDEIAAVIHADVDNDATITIKNALAWFSGEEVCRYLVESGELDNEEG